LRNPDQAVRNSDQTGRRDFAQYEASLTEVVMNVSIKELPASKVAYLRHIGPYGPPIGKFWEEFERASAAQGLSGTCYGIGHDDPSITPADKCRYDACVEVGADTQVQAPFSTMQLPGGRYAMMEFEGSSATIGAAWMDLYGVWLPSSGMQTDDRLPFEIMRKTDRHDPVTGRFTCALCIPVEPLR
jgi:AraC family transcriptional regulator